MALTKVDISLMDNTGTTANKLLAYDGSGNLPAVDGSQLTNIATGILESTSDPTTSTNPSGGVGTQWNNKTSGEVYICTDATAGSNVWTNVGAGTDNIKPWAFGGTNYGYSMGIYPSTAQIQKFSLSSDGNAVNAGVMTVARSHASGAQNTTHGYCAGGCNGGTNVIDKFQFSTDGDSTDVGNLTTSAICGAAGQSSETYGYACGGDFAISNIEKFSLSSDGNATDSGDISSNRMAAAGASSSAHGYCSGGHDASAQVNIIEKFSFAADSNTADVGDLVRGIDTGMSGQSSATYGYGAGGVGNWQNIDKWAFASDGNSTDVGDLTAAHNTAAYSAGVSSITYGYCAGGGGSPKVNVIDKWAFASDGNATDVGDLTATLYYNCGVQY